jgi:hypothetical protein
MMIYESSSTIEVSPVRFFEDNETALEDMKQCAEAEQNLNNNNNTGANGSQNTQHYGQ